MRKLIVILVCLLMFGFSACTAQQRAKAYGGTATINLPKGEKLINVTWKENAQLWYLTRPMRADEQPEKYTFREDSNFGIMQGTVVVIEQK